jgi:hypothetical protein
VDPTPEEEGEDAGAREDEGTSRKRARYEWIESVSFIHSVLIAEFFILRTGAN